MEPIDFRPFKDVFKKMAFSSPFVTRVQGIVGGADDDEPYFTLGDPFVLDIIKIEGSKAIRRLRDKTQVFTGRANPHIRTRLSHTMEVKNVAMCIASILGLNVRLCEAIALGHDIGHAPLGHFGEMMLSELSGKRFRHNVFSATVANAIERKGKGLGLVRETAEGIVYHSRSGSGHALQNDVPMEYNVVAIADKIAFNTSDINDAIRLGYLTHEHVIARLLGKNQRERVLNCIFALIRESSEKGQLSFSDSQLAQDFMVVREWLKNNVYLLQNDINDHYRAVFERTFRYLASQPHFSGHDPAVIIALMTDDELCRFHDNVVSNGLPGDVASAPDFGFGFMEILPSLQPNIDFTSAYL